MALPAAEPYKGQQEVQILQTPIYFGLFSKYVHEISKNSPKGTLDVYWVVHNFMRPHFTTKEVPAVALGILDKRLYWDELFMIFMAA